MKKVHTTEMVAHVWANQNQSEGRSNNGQFFFEGKRLYSYGRHFLVALAFAPGVYLINSDTYSITTTRHQGYCRRAIRSEATNFYIAHLTSMVSASYSFDEFSLDSFLSYYSHIKPEAWSQGLDDFLQHVAPKQAKALIAACVKRYKAHAFKTAKAELASNQALAKAFIAKCKELGGKADTTRETVTFTSLNSAYQTQYNVSEIEGHNTLPHFVTALNRWLVHCRKYDKADQVKAYVWPIVKAWRAHLEFKVSRRIKDNRLRNLKETFNEIRVSRDLSDLDFYCNVNPYPYVNTIFARHGARAIVANMKTRLWLGKVEDDAKQKALAEERAKADMEKKAAYFTSWIEGGTVSSFNLPIHPMGYDFAYLRIKGNEVQTSKGASVPLEHAIKLYRFMKAVKQPWEGSHAVGHFRLTSISEGVATIGCHKLHIDDMDALYATLEVA